MSYEMHHCWGCGKSIPQLLVENNTYNFRCDGCGCETRPQTDLFEAERLWNEGRTYPVDEREFWAYLDRKHRGEIDV